MGEIFDILFFRSLIRSVGLYTRFYFFKFIGKKRSLKSLSNERKDPYKDMGHALEQDLTNAIVGAIIVIPSILLLAYLAFR